MSLNQKFNKPISTYSSRISDTLYQVKRALAEMPRLKEGNAITFLNYMSEQILIEHSLPSISQFLGYTYSQTAGDLQTLTCKAKHEEEKLEIGKGKKFKDTSKSGQLGLNERRKYCSHCKTTSHNTSDCRSKTIKTCSYCHKKGHEEKDCRTKANQKKNYLKNPICYFIPNFLQIL